MTSTSRKQLHNTRLRSWRCAACNKTQAIFQALQSRKTVKRTPFSIGIASYSWRQNPIRDRDVQGNPHTTKTWGIYTFKVKGALSLNPLKNLWTGIPYWKEMRAGGSEARKPEIWGRANLWPVFDASLHKQLWNEIMKKHTHPKFKTTTWIDLTQFKLSGIS